MSSQVDGPRNSTVVLRASQQYSSTIKETQWPIVYSPEYNIAFCRLERLHPFDSGKWGRIFEYLKDASMVRDDTVVEPEEATEEELLMVHTKKYLAELRWSLNVAAITEVPPVALLPNFMVQRKVLRPFRYQTSGTIMAGRLALERGWAINIGGGFHHCSSERGGGFCAYADITLCIRFAFERMEGVARAMIIDLDAHQGNGHERDFMNDERVYILDVYNRSIYPHDGYAKRAISRRVELAPYTEDQSYLESVRTHVEGALNEFDPHLVVYNAGTDILEGDPLGCLSVSAQGIIERDQVVFQKCRTRGIPVLMVTSGGYQRQTAKIVADSILNLHNLRLITCEEAENAPFPVLRRSNNAAEAGAASLSHSRSDGGLFARFRRSCLSRASNSTNSISSLNMPSPCCDEGPGQIGITGETAAKGFSDQLEWSVPAIATTGEKLASNLPPDQQERSGPVLPSESAFAGVGSQGNTLTDDCREEGEIQQPLFTLNTSVNPPGVSGVSKDERQPIQDLTGSSGGKDFATQPCLSESLPLRGTATSENLPLQKTATSDSLLLQETALSEILPFQESATSEGLPLQETATLKSLPLEGQATSESLHSKGKAIFNPNISTTATKNELENVGDCRGETVMDLCEALSSLKHEDLSVTAKQTPRGDSREEYDKSDKESDGYNRFIDQENSNITSQCAEDLASDFTVTVNTDGEGMDSFSPEML